MELPSQRRVHDLSRSLGDGHPDQLGRRTVITHDIVTGPGKITSGHTAGQVCGSRPEGGLVQSHSNGAKTRHVSNDFCKLNEISRFDA